MQRCASCGTRLEPGWDVCWLCHAPVPASVGSARTPDPEEPKHIATDHVASGPLVRTGHHTATAPMAAAIWRPGMGHRGRVMVTVAILVVAVASTGLFLPYVTYALVYGVFIALLSTYAVFKLWRGHT